MTALVPIEQKQTTAKIVLSSVQKSIRHLPLLVVVQLIANPAIVSNLVQTIMSTPSGSHFNDQMYLYLFGGIAAGIYWAFLAGGSNLLFLALARNQPTKISMIFSRRNLFRRYLAVGLLGSLCQSILMGIIIMICFVAFDPAQPGWIYALRGLGVVIAAGAAVWLYTKFGFTDLAIADRDLDVLRAAKYSNGLGVGSFWKLVPFYAVTMCLAFIFAILHATAQSGNSSIAEMHQVLIALLLSGAVGQTVINFWRVQIYCRLSQYQETIEKSKEGEVTEKISPVAENK